MDGSHYGISDIKDAKWVKKRTQWFILYNDILYKQSCACHLLHCLMLEEGEMILDEIQKGVCSSHIGGRVLVVAVIMIG